MLKRPLNVMIADSIARLRHPAPEVFFVVGHPRSGTNWVSNLLSLHPQVFCDGEFHFHDILRAVERSSTHPWQAAGREPMKSALRTGFEDMVRKTVRSAALAKPGVRLAGDRTPRHLEPMLPGARHIVCVRDGRDVIVSWTFHLLKHGGAWLTTGESGADMSRLKEEFDRDAGVFEREPERLLSVDAWLEHVAQEWAQRVRSDQKVSESMTSFPEIGSVLWVSYERLHEEVDRERARMYSFLGVDPSLATTIHPDSWVAPGYTRGDPREYFRSGKVGDWKRFFGPRQTEIFMAHAGDALKAAQDIATGHSMAAAI